jgi:hypothetical protein
MKTIVLLLAALLYGISTHAQIGQTKEALLAHWGQDKVLKESEGSRPGYSALLLGLDSVRYLQVTFKAEKAVMVTIMHTDSTITEQRYQQYLSENIPGFAPRRSCQLGAKSYLIDGGKNQLVVQHHREDAGAYPLISLVIAIDPAIIKGLMGRMEGVCQ